MQLRIAFFTLLGAVITLVKAQMAPNLTTLLTSIPELSIFTAYVAQEPEFVKYVINYSSNLTILAPSNAVFESLLKENITGQLPVYTGRHDNTTIRDVFFYHVLDGTFYSSAFVEGQTAVANTLFKNNELYANLGYNNPQVVLGRRNAGNVEVVSGLGEVATVERANLEFDGGIVHIINNALTLPLPISFTASKSNLTALAGALLKADLLKTVDETPSLTVFAPNNAAFQAIGNLLPGLRNQELSNILKYHVVAGNPLYTLPGPDDGDLRLKTLQGGNVTVHEHMGQWFVNGARIVGGNKGGVLVGNGIVYVIDSVLNPSYGNLTTTYMPNPTLSTQPPAFPSASFMVDIPLTTALPNGTATQTATSTPTDNGATGVKITQTIPVTSIAMVVGFVILGGYRFFAF